MFCRKGVLRNFTKVTVKHLCQSISLIKLQTATCEISNKTFFYRTPPVAASDPIEVYKGVLFEEIFNGYYSLGVIR